MNNQNLLDLLTLALPYVEDCTENPAYKPAAVQELADRMRAAINASDWDYYTFPIAEHFAPAMINGDYSGLSDGESDQLDEFLSSFGKGHWDIGNDDEDYRTCDVCGLYSKTVQMQFHFKQSDRV